MGIFSRKKKPTTMDLPPPPSPEELAGEVKAPKDIAKSKIEIKSSSKKYDIPPPPDELLPQMPGKPLFRGDVAPIRGGSKREHPAMPKMPPAEEFMLRKPMPEMPKLSPEMGNLRQESMPKARENIEPIFIEIGDYQAILERSKKIKNTLKGAEESVMRLGNIKAEEERIISEWKKQIEDVEKKITYVDEAVFGGE